MSDADESTAVKIAKIETSLEAVQDSLQNLTRQWEMLHTGTQETQKLFGRLEQLLSAQELRNSQMQSNLDRHEQENNSIINNLRDKVATLEVQSAQEKATIYGVISGVRRTSALVSGCLGVIMALLTYICTEKFEAVKDLQRQVVFLQVWSKQIPPHDSGKEK